MSRCVAGLVLLLVLRVPADAGCRTLADAPDGRWRVVSRAGVAWLLDPCGRRFFSIGINGVDGGAPAREDRGRITYAWSAFQPDLPAWLRATRARMVRWGFNTAGAGSLPPDLLEVPVMPDLELGRTATFHWVDPFDPATETRIAAEARRLVTPFRGSAYRIGYFTDNEVGWWGGALFAFYARQPATNRAKQRLVALLREHYAADWTRFARDWVPPAGVGSFAGLLDAAIAPRLRPGGDGIRVVRAWTALVAGRYYALTTAALRAADPGALVLGDRLPIYYDPDAVRAMAPFVDAVATNYDVDTSDGWIARYYFDGLHDLTGGKPVLVSEWFFAADENRTGNRNAGHLMRVRTQAERARGAAAAARRFAMEPDVVGLHWFQLYDHPKGGRHADGEDYDFGLVDVDDRPYDELVDALAAANASLPALHAQAARRPTVAGRFAVPHAAVDPHDRALADWPMEPALVPGVAAAPGEVPFADFYLSWSGSGLALAVIGMDYYAPGLLAYEGDFPREEAFRVDWGVDAGRGPVRFALRVIPPATFADDAAPLMRAELCRADGAGCVAVPGAVATYFGSDQPRITLEATIPWAALGLATPPRAPLRMELAATAWHRSRWLSWSGRAPAAALADAAGWHTVALAGDDDDAMAASR